MKSKKLKDRRGIAKAGSRKKTRKKSLMPGMKEAIKEIRAHLFGIKSLPSYK